MDLHHPGYPGQTEHGVAAHSMATQETELVWNPQLKVYLELPSEASNSKDLIFSQTVPPAGFMRDTGGGG